MPVTTMVVMTKKQLDLYLDLLDERIQYLRLKDQTSEDKKLLIEYTHMRTHGYNAKEFFR